MTIVKVVGVGGAVSTAVLVLAAKASEDTTPFWPVSVSGWVALFAGVAGLTASLYALHRFSLKPIQTEIARVDGDGAAKLKAAKDELAVQLATYHRETEVARNDFRLAVDLQMNGFGRRVEAIEREQAEMRTMLVETVADLSASKEDRRHLNSGMDEVKEMLREMRDSARGGR